MSLFDGRCDQSLFGELSLGPLRRQARCARRMYVGKIKYRDQHRVEDRTSALDRGGGAEDMTSTLDRGGSTEHMGGILRRSDHAEGRAHMLDRGGGAEHMADMLRQGALAASERIRSKNERLSSRYSAACVQRKALGSRRAERASEPRKG